MIRRALLLVGQSETRGRKIEPDIVSLAVEHRQMRPGEMAGAGIFERCTLSSRYIDDATILHVIML